MPIATSDFILNADGSIYHLCLTPHDMTDTVILVGDPERVPRVSCHFDRVDFTRRNREFHIEAGELNGQRLMVLSTGIGVGAIDVVINELDALVNIDFETREVKDTLTTLNLIRLGTAGGLQPDVPLGTLCVSDFAMAFDGVLQFYQQPCSTQAQALQAAAASHFAQLPVVHSLSVAESAEKWQTRFSASGFMHGLTMTCAGFYGPQARQLRAPLIAYPFLQQVQDFHFNDMRVLNYEMETAAILGLSRVLGHQACSLSVLLANRGEQTFVKDPQGAVDRMIAQALECF